MALHVHSRSLCGHVELSECVVDMMITCLSLITLWLMLLLCSGSDDAALILIVSSAIWWLSEQLIRYCRCVLSSLPCCHRVCHSVRICLRLQLLWVNYATLGWASASFTSIVCCVATVILHCISKIITQLWNSIAQNYKDFDDIWQKFLC